MGVGFEDGVVEKIDEGREKLGQPLLLRRALLHCLYSEGERLELSNSRQHLLELKAKEGLGSEVLDSGS